MISEQQLISRIKGLNQIKPRKDWVFLTKTRILGEASSEKGISIWEVLPRILFHPKLAIASALTIFTILGLVGFTRNSLPGDPLYAIKRVGEKTQAVFISEEKQPGAQLELANKRLNELTKIAESNQIKKLASALQEYQASIGQAAKNLTQQKSATTSDPSVIKNIAQQTQKLEDTKNRLERIYGIAGLEAKEGENPTKIITDWLIKDLEKRTLTEDQADLLSEAKESFSIEDYNTALIKILQLSELNYPQN